ncbi:MAG: hypothetical protein KatS3mg010_0714 [Acidimicrobiia bacterium]|nr:MAG: hypothetical protein KatS3mg010_0714 [Acidimicrobiia bacterium]
MTGIAGEAFAEAPVRRRHWPRVIAAVLVVLAVIGGMLVKKVVRSSPAGANTTPRRGPHRSER